VKRILALCALLLLGGLCAGAWWVQTAQALDLVEVDTGRPLCAGAAFEGDRTILAQRGMSCTVRITLANTGSRTVHVDHVTLPYFGSQGGMVVQAGPATAQRLRDRGVDATLPIDQDLDSGDLLQFDVTIAFREGGCSGGAQGGVERLKPWPHVSIGFLGRSIDQTGDGVLSFSQYGPARSCQRR
jgi:hypothetical protein